MALETKRAAVNTAMDGVIAALKDLFDGISSGDADLNKVMVLFPSGVARVSGAAASDPVFPTDPARQNRYVIKVPADASTMSYVWHIPPVINYIPLVWKITNSEGEI